MTDEDIIALLEKYHNGTATPLERAAVDEWYNRQAASEANMPGAGELAAAKAGIWENVADGQLKVKRLFPYRKIAVAAAVALVAGSLWWMADRGKPPAPGMLHEAAVHDIAPGRNGATLTLGNGQKIVLSEAANGNLAKEAGVVISKNADGEIVYETVSGEQAAGNSLNILATARGESYQVKLPDGTMVWLNAASSIKYPPSFSAAGQRIVELTGEAYFEVSKDKHRPFIVKTTRQEVEVLGTHFNVSAYVDEAAVKTTLVEGSIRLAHLAAGKKILLKPGQQATATDAGLQAAAANVEEALAWKNGSFMFNGEGLESVMKKISRWYNVDVAYLRQPGNITFTGEISRARPLSAVLNAVSKTGRVTFSMEKGRIIVQ